jgi:hypothetical protein
MGTTHEISVAEPWPLLHILKNEFLPYICQWKEVEYKFSIPEQHIIMMRLSNTARKVIFP